MLAANDFHARRICVAEPITLEHDNNGRHYRIGKDDSGKDDNACIKLRLQKDSTYLVNIRMLYRNPDVVPALMLW